MKNDLTHRNFICPKCHSPNYETMISVTNSTYVYCNNCNHNYYNVYKQKHFDIIFKELVEFIKSNKYSSLRIHITQDNNNFSLTVNDVKLITVELSHGILNKDIYFLENTVHELVEDFSNSDIFNNDIIICA